MKAEYIIESIGEAIDTQIYDEWKHEGFIMGGSNTHLNFELDGKEYVIVLHEVEEGKDFSFYIGEGK